MNVRTARAQEAEAIRDLINLAFRVERFFVEGDRIALDEVLERFATGQFLAAGDPPFGCVYVEPRGERAYLGLLSVDPARQGQGIGKRLMAAAEDRCRELGCRFVDLMIVDVRRELPAFYGSLGYTESGTEPFPAEVPTKIPCCFVRMSKALR
jgi:predicted N-acetyltransferase YhbS